MFLLSSAARSNKAEVSRFKNIQREQLTQTEVFL